jgi:hypothetical protein
LDAKDFYAVVFNGPFEMTGLFQSPTNDKAIELLYRDKEATAQEPRNTNVFIVSFITLARLKFYGLLEPLGRRVFYYDTGSVIYVTSATRGDASISLGM